MRRLLEELLKRRRNCMRGRGSRAGGDSAPLFTAEDIEAMLQPSSKFHRIKPRQSIRFNTR